MSLLDDQNREAPLGTAQRRHGSGRAGTNHDHIVAFSPHAAFSWEALACLGAVCCLGLQWLLPAQAVGQARRTRLRILDPTPMPGKVATMSPTAPSEKPVVLVTGASAGIGD